MGQQIGFQCAVHGFNVVMFNLIQPSLDTCRAAHGEFATTFRQENRRPTEEVITRTDIDKTWMNTSQMGMGPFGFMDVVGLGTVAAIFGALSEQSDDDIIRRNAAYLEKNFVAKGKLGMKSGEGFYRYPEPDYQRPEFLS